MGEGEEARRLRGKWWGIPGPGVVPMSCGPSQQTRAPPSELMRAQGSAPGGLSIVHTFPRLQSTAFWRVGVREEGLDW